MSAEHKILIVEDEKIIAKALEIKLLGLGYEIIGSVTNGPEAIELVRNQKPDIILMDIALEGNMTGIETAAAIQAEQDIPVVYLTAYADENTFQNAIKTNPYGYLIKPVNEERNLDLTIKISLQKHGFEQKIKESETRYKSLFEQSQEAILILNDDGKILEANQAALDIYTLRKDLSHYTIYNLVQPREQEQLKANWRNFLLTGEMTGRYKFIDKYLQIKYLDYHAKSNFLPGTHLAVIRDITQSVESQREIENLARFPAEAPHPVLRVTLSGDIIFANKAAAIFLNEWSGKYPNRLPDNLKTKLQSMNAIDSQFSINLSIRNRYYLLLFVYVPKGGYVNIYGTDITAQKQSERIINHQKDIMELIAKGENLVNVLDRICTKIYQFMPDGLPAIHIYDDNKKVLRFLSGPRLPLDFISLIQTVQPAKRNTTTGVVGYTKDLVVSHDIKSDENWAEYKNELKHSPINSCWGIPVLGAHDELLAVISIFYRDYHKPDTNELNLVNMACKLAGIAIERDKSYQSLYKQSLTFENISDAIILTDMEGVITEFSPSAERLFKYNRNDVVGKKIQDIHLFEKQETLEQTLQESLSRSEDWNHRYVTETEFIKRDQQRGIAELSVVNLNDITGVQQGILRVVRDITNKRQIESALRTSERYLKAIFENTVQSFVLIDKEARILTFNKTARQLTLDLTGKKLESNELLTDYWYSDDIKEFLTVFERALGGEYVKYEKRFKNDHSPTLWLEINFLPVYDDENTLTNICFTALDITDRKAAELELIDSEARFRSLVQNSSDMITVVDEQGKINYVSESVSKMLGFHSSDIVNHSLDEFIHRDDHTAYHALLKQVQQSGSEENFSVEYRMINASKQYLYIESVWNNQLGNKNILGMVVNSRDITQRKEAEMELKRTNFELDSFVYRASHDLRAPLRSVLGLLNLIKADSNPDNSLKYISLAEKSINKLDTFIIDLTNFSRNTRLEIKKELIQFDAIIEECIQNHMYMENAARVKPIVEIAPNIEFYSDPSRINILLSNLISNAIKYQRTEPELESFFKVQIESSGSGVLITVSDNGKGIGEEYLNQIFEMFFRASEDSYGSGLGLYITKQVVEKLGGKITVNSKIKEGTTFTVFLPSLK
jgi:PAS domain S-box-containing protein